MARLHCATYIGGVSERELSLAVVGIDYPNADKGKTNRRFQLALCAPGDPVELRREPKNPHDEHAVAVFDQRGIQLGYLQSERAVYIGAKMAAGEELVAVFQELLATIGVIRVRFGGGEPTLPPPSEQRPRGPAIGDDFYPDPEGPEWGA